MKRYIIPTLWIAFMANALKIRTLFTVAFLIASLFSARISAQTPYVIKDTDASRYTYETLETSVGTLNYRKLSPRKSQEKYPLVIFLHGAGERGDDNARQLIHGSKIFADSSEKYPAYVLFPQCDTHQYWAYSSRPDNLDATTFPVSYDISNTITMVRELIDRYLAQPDIDSNRVYISGLSMGGFGTFDIVCRYPEIFAAAIPICGGVNPARLTGDGVKNVYWRIFHGAVDVIVPVSNSRKADSALAMLGADVEYIEYPDVNHNVWDYVFVRPDYLSWLFGKMRKAIITNSETPDKDIPVKGQTVEIGR
ncbi:MAG: prolyl oligopeptidase family serine peptidase [Bacteroidales bacterium]|jgi:predicted peptidase|nr:prolyl oligopeptidase family serine peptidase [Bacteroidales bacterium]